MTYIIYLNDIIKFLLTSLTKTLFFLNVQKVCLLVGLGRRIYVMIKYKQFILVSLLILVFEPLYANRNGRRMPAREGSQEVLKPSEQIQPTSPEEITDGAKPLRDAGLCRDSLTNTSTRNRISNSGNYSITEVVAENDLDSVKSLIESKVDVDSRRARFGKTALMIAIINNNIEIAYLLLEAGASVHSTDGEGNTPLHYAKDVELIQKLVDIGAGVHARNKEDQTPLHKAKNVEISRALIELGADVHARDDKGNTPLHLARNALMVSFLLTSRADPNARDKKFKTLLHKIQIESIAVLVLIDHGADIEAEDMDGRTPLHNAANGSIAYQLIQREANVHARDNTGKTPMHTARNERIAQLLIEAGVDVSTPDDYGSTPLHTTRSAGVAGLLIKHGADIDAVDRYGRKPDASANLEVKAVLAAERIARGNYRNGFVQRAVSLFVR